MIQKYWRGRSVLFLCLAVIILLQARAVTAQTDGQVIEVMADQIATAVSNANPGDTLQVTGGIYHGSLEIDKSLTLIGIDWPVIDAGNEGSVLTITGEDVQIRGFVIRNSGSSLDQENTGIAVEAPGAVIEHNRFEETLFGIYLRQAHGSTIRGNVINSKDLDVPRRGDPIRVWYSNDVVVEDNVINKGRDVVLWYSERLTIRNNDVQNGRYGLHFMYCDDATIEQNRLLNNSVGAFMMYSRRVHIINNTIAHNRGPSGYGVGLKDMDDAIIEENLFLDNRIGAHLDTSPREIDSIGQYTGNVFAYNDIGVEMSPSVKRNEFSANSFVENEEQVSVAGGGRLQGNFWTIGGTGNYWSDYAGYDADGDGQGDLVYRSDRLFENLMQQQPELRLFLYSPATNAIDFAAKAFPIVKPQPKLEDERPLMAPIIPDNTPPLPQPEGLSWLWLTLALFIPALSIANLSRSRDLYQFGSSHHG